MTADVVALDAAGLIDPYPLYAEWRATGRVARDRRRDLWVVAGYDEVQSVLRRHDDFSSQVGPLAALHGDPSLARLEASVLLRALLAGTTALGRDPSRPAQRRATLVVRGWRSLPITVELSPDARGGPWTSS